MILLRAAILLFVPGILKCLEKPWALKNATVTSIMNSSDPRLDRTLEEDDGVQKDIYSQEDYVQAAAECVATLESKSEVLFEDEVADQLVVEATGSAFKLVEDLDIFGDKEQQNEYS